MSRLVVRNVAKEYPTRSEPLVVLRDVSLEIEAGDNVAVIGPSGSGKSTLLHILGALEQPTSGDVSLDEQSINHLDDSQLATFRNQQIGFVFQEHHLLPQCSVLENTLLPALADGSPSQAVIDRGRVLLDRVGLSARLDHRPAELSGGERQRAALARALVLEPKLLLADEPTGSLDRSTADAVAELLLELHRQQRTIMVVVTHNLELAARMNRQYELDDGRLVEQAPVG